MDLATDALGVAPMRGSELGRAEEAALMDGVERSGREEVEGAGDTQVDPVMHERLAGEVSDVDPDRPRPELHQQPAHPWLELRRPFARDRRPARVRPAGDVQDGQIADRRKGPKGIHQTVHELRHDRRKVRLRRDLRGEPMSHVDFVEGTGQ